MQARNAKIEVRDKRVTNVCFNQQYLVTQRYKNLHTHVKLRSSVKHLIS